MLRNQVLKVLDGRLYMRLMHSRLRYRLIVLLNSTTVDGILLSSQLLQLASQRQQVLLSAKIVKTDILSVLVPRHRNQS